MRSPAALVLAHCLFGGTASLLAQPPVPAGLQPGDHYHLIFVTSFTTGIVTNTSVPPPFYPSWGGIDAADYIINDTAATAGLIQDWNFTDVTWKAVLSTSTINAKDRMPITGPVYNTRGELVANNSADMWDGSIAHAIKYDESGGDIFSNFAVFTGANPAGMATTAPCGSNWNNPAGSCIVGNLSFSDVHWLVNAGSFCTASARLYGISPALTVPQPGDYTGDGAADAADYVVWRHRNGPSTDYDRWRAHFGESIPASGTATTETTAVPEPSSFAMLVMLTVILSAAKNLRRPRCARVS